MKNLFLIAFVMLGLGFSSSVFAAGGAGTTNTTSFPHPSGSTFTPATITPTLPSVNSAVAQSKENAVLNENAAAESAVTQTPNQVNQTLNNRQTRHDLNAKAVVAPSPAGMPAGYQGQVPNFNGMPPNVLQNTNK